MKHINTVFGAERVSTCSYEGFRRILIFRTNFAFGFWERQEQVKNVGTV
jgi:hypothetical protein